MKRILACIAFLGIFVSIAVAHPGVGIVIDTKGNIFYTDLTHVWKITPDGSHEIAVRDVHTHELYIDSEDNLYGEHEWYEGEATDKWGNYVWRLSSEGVFEKTIDDVEGFLDNNTLVRDLQGNSYWAIKMNGYEQVMRHNPDGSDILATDHHFDDIRWMYYSKHDSHLYIVDKLNVYKVSRSGATALVTADLKNDGKPFNNVADRHYIFGLWTDDMDNLYAAVYGRGEVNKIDADGRETTVYASPDGWSPCGGLVTGDGTMWMMEFSTDNSTRVVKIESDGSRTLFEGRT